MVEKYSNLLSFSNFAFTRPAWHKNNWPALENGPELISRNRPIIKICTGEKGLLAPEKTALGVVLHMTK